MEEGGSRELMHTFDHELNHLDDQVKFDDGSSADYDSARIIEIILNDYFHNKHAFLVKNQMIELFETLKFVFDDGSCVVQYIFKKENPISPCIHNYNVSCEIDGRKRSSELCHHYLKGRSSLSSLQGSCSVSVVENINNDLTGSIYIYKDHSVIFSSQTKIMFPFYSDIFCSEVSCGNRTQNLHFVRRIEDFELNFSLGSGMVSNGSQ